MQKPGHHISVVILQDLPVRMVLAVILTGSGIAQVTDLHVHMQRIALSRVGQSNLELGRPTLE